MKTLIRFGLLVLCLGFAVDSASAQPPTGGRQSGGRQGGGTQQASPTQLLRSKTVQDALDISEEQLEKVKAWSEKFQSEARAKVQEMLKDVPREQMREKFGEIQEKMSEEMEQGLSKVLTEKQMTRLHEIEMQLQGTAALSMKKVREKLKLSDEQKEKLTDLGEQARTESRELMQELGLGGSERPAADVMEKFRAKFNSLRKSADKKMGEVLTKDQKAAWEKMTGEKIDVEKVRQEMTPERRPRNNNDR